MRTRFRGPPKKNKQNRKWKRKKRAALRGNAILLRKTQNAKYRSAASDAVKHLNYCADAVFQEVEEGREGERERGREEEKKRERGGKVSEAEGEMGERARGRADESARSSREISSVRYA